MDTHIVRTAEFGGTPLPVIQHAGDYWMGAEAVGQALEYADPSKAILNLYQRHRALLTDYSAELKLTAADGKLRDTRCFNEEGVMLIAMKSEQPKAIEFQRWAVGVLKDYRHGALTAAQTDLVATQQKYIALLERHQKRAPRRLRRITEADQAKILEMKAQGMPQVDIAGILEVSEAVVSLVVRGKYPLRPAPDGATAPAAERDR